MEAPGVCGGSRSLGLGFGSGVVGRDMVGSAGRCGSEGESANVKRLCWVQVLYALVKPEVGVKGGHWAVRGAMCKRLSEM